MSKVKSIAVGLAMTAVSIVAVAFISRAFLPAGIQNLFRFQA